MSNVKPIWYVKGLVNHLNDLGYVHFVVKEPVTDTFKTGIAFYYDTEKKQYGKMDFISGDDEIKEAFRLRDEMTELISKKGEQV